MVAGERCPGLARLLPRPGAWMVWFKQVLAFPLYGTVAWLIWVLIQEVEPGERSAALFGLVAVGFAVWIYGRTRLAARRMRRVGGGLAHAGLAAAVILAATLSPGRRAPLARGASGGLAYEPFSTARLDRADRRAPAGLRQPDRRWCITCLVNERTTLDRDAVRARLRRARRRRAEGRLDPAGPDITAFLQRFGRSGVPLYLLYDKAGDADGAAADPDRSRRCSQRGRQ